MVRIMLAPVVVLTFMLSLLLATFPDSPAETAATSGKRGATAKSEKKPSREEVERAIAAKHLGVPNPEDIEYPDDEPPSREEVELGKALFFDKKLSGSQKTSCATCHDPAKGFSDGRPRSIADRGNMMRNAPHLYNLAWSSVLLWRGNGGDNLDTLVPRIVKNPNIMNLPPDKMVERLKEIPYYSKTFKKLYPDGLTAGNVGKGIGAFARSIITRNSAFDRYLKGDDSAMSAKALRGLMLFVGKARCAACHDGVNFTDDSFHNTGLETDDIGRGKFEKGEHFKFAFKTPGLRNTVLTGPYMHDGSIKTLREIVEFYNKGGMRKEGIDPEIKPLNLGDEEIDELLAFLEALTDLVEVTPPPMDLLSKKSRKEANGTLSGQFSFLRKPSRVALIYFSEDKGLKQGLTIDQKGKQFLSQIAVGSPGVVITFKNSDKIDHNIYADDKRLGIKFDLGLMRAGSNFSGTQPISWEAGEVVKIGCKIHPKIRFYAVSLTSRYHRVLEFNGEKVTSFRFEVPPGKLTKVAVWLPKYDPINVSIKPGERKDIELKKKGKLRGTLFITRK